MAGRVSPRFEPQPRGKGGNMPAPRMIRSLTPFLILLAIAGICPRGAESKNDLPASVPLAVPELKALEARAADAIRKALPAIVAVNVTRSNMAARPLTDRFDPGASGVVISRDGLIL